MSGKKFGGFSVKLSHLVNMNRSIELSLKLGQADMDIFLNFSPMTRIQNKLTVLRIKASPCFYLAVFFLKSLECGEGNREEILID